MRLIDANALVQELLSITYLGCDGGYYKGRADERDDTLQRIKDAPTVEPKREWIPVSDRFPECGDEYLVASGSTVKTAYLDGDNDWIDGVYILKYVTHWMLLPEPPNCGAKMKG